MIHGNGSKWQKQAHVKQEVEGGRVTEFDSGNCYLPCASGYDTHDLTCTRWKSQCVYWNWFGTYWTGCGTPKVCLFDSGIYNEIKSQPDKWRAIFCIF